MRDGAVEPVGELDDTVDRPRWFHDEHTTSDTAVRLRIPDVDEHSADGDTGQEHLHVAVHGDPLDRLRVDQLVERPVVDTAPDILAHEETEDGHRN